MICIPCEREKSKLPLLIELAKNRAKRENEYTIIYFDKEDKKYRITTYENGKTEKVKPYGIYSPY